MQIIANYDFIWFQSFVYDNDLFTQSAPESNATRLTTTGQSEQIFNGYTDWLYEGETRIIFV